MRAGDPQCNDFFVSDYSSMDHGQMAGQYQLKEIITAWIRYLLSPRVEEKLRQDFKHLLKLSLQQAISKQDSHQFILCYLLVGFPFF